MPHTYDLSLIHNPDAGIERLIEIMRHLRDPDIGCPWDVEQTLQTLAPYALEEAYEVVDAIERDAIDELPGELGDLLLQTVFQSQVAKDQGQFTFQDVVRQICEKLISRHPHVFGAESCDKTAAQQTEDWETLKTKERGRDSNTLDGVALTLPALTRAVKLQKRAARVGFDWPQTGQVLDKIKEESQELVEAQESLTQAQVHEEFGDLMFVMANLARHLKVDPEEALRAANQKFTRRFTQVEVELRHNGKRPQDSSLEEMDTLWDKVKAQEKQS